MTRVTWLADVLRASSLPVIEDPEWQSRGRGPMREVKGVMLHHTAGPARGDSPSLRIVREGRADLPGPLSQLFLTRQGVYHVLASGRCNHAGRGRWQGVTSGNSSFIGIEAENMGTSQDPWPGVQMESYVEGVAAILRHLRTDSVMAVGHKEYALPRGRKIDPSFDMHDFRSEVQDRMSTLLWNSPPRVSSSSPQRSMLRKGDSGRSVRELQKRLGIKADGHFGPNTELAVRDFQRKFGLGVDGLVGPATWKALETRT